MSESDPHVASDGTLPDKGVSEPAPVPLSYATRAAIAPARRMGVTNPGALLTSYWVGAGLTMLALLVMDQRKELRHGGLGLVLNDAMAAFGVGGLWSTIFAFVLTRRAFPSSRSPRKGSVVFSVLAGTVHVTLFPVAAWVFEHWRASWGLGAMVLICIFFVFPLVAAILLRRPESN